MLSQGKYVEHLTSSGRYSEEEAKEIVQALLDLARIAHD
jgi:hypothetical protein